MQRIDRSLLNYGLFNYGLLNYGVLYYSIEDTNILAYFIRRIPSGHKGRNISA